MLKALSNELGAYTQNNLASEFPVPYRSITEAKLVLKQLNTQFYLHFPFYLAEQYNDLASALVRDIFHYHRSQMTLTVIDKQAIHDFVAGYRLYEPCAYHLMQGLLWLLTSSVEYPNVEVEPLITRILQKKSIEQTCALYSFTGKKQLNNFIIQQFKQILLHLESD